MRPPEFTGGNVNKVLAAIKGTVRASMRPPEFTGGNGGTAYDSIALVELQ